jgi:hypothetical protein
MSLRQSTTALIVIVSVFATALVVFVSPEFFLRPFIVFWFICTCPGMALVTFFHVREKTTAWTLTLALSFTFDALVATIQLYANWWSPSITLVILLAFCFSCAIIQLISRKQTRFALAKQKRRATSANLSIWHFHRKT